MVLAGDEAVLDQLPDGDWIGGTIPYFMGSEGGVVTRELVYVDELPEQVDDVRIATYGPDELEWIPADGFDNGYSVVILPAGAETHTRFAAEAPEYEGLFDRPLVGWVAGHHLDDLGTASAATYAAGRRSTDRAVALHVSLSEGAQAVADIVNLFRQGDGAVLTFDGTGFSHDKVRVDGEQRDFAEYLREVGHDIQLPLVADYFGAMINVSFQAVDDGDGPVSLYAPVFEGVEYKLAAPVGDYVAEFTAELPIDTVAPAFACNCILNFVYSELEGRRTGDITGPITFGEICYQLLNQTLVHLTIHD
jgi:hypothetical protein